MRRFRYTLIAICLVLLFLGVSDLILWFNNQAPQAVNIEALEQTGPPGEWLQVTAGYQDLDRAISTSGTVEMEALLIPLVMHPDQEQIKSNLLSQTNRFVAMRCCKNEVVSNLQACFDQAENAWVLLNR